MKIIILFYCFSRGNIVANCTYLTASALTQRKTYSAMYCTVYSTVLHLTWVSPADQSHFVMRSDFTSFLQRIWSKIQSKSSQLYWAVLNSAHSLLEVKLRFLLINDAFKCPSFGTKYAQIYDPRCSIFYSIKTLKSSTIFRRRFPWISLFLLTFLDYSSVTAVHSGG